MEKKVIVEGKSDLVYLIGILKFIKANNARKPTRPDKSLERVESLAERLWSTKLDKFKIWITEL